MTTAASNCSDVLSFIFFLFFGSSEFLCFSFIPDPFFRFAATSMHFESRLDMSMHLKSSNRFDANATRSPLECLSLAKYGDLKEKQIRSQYRIRSDRYARVLEIGLATEA